MLIRYFSGQLADSERHAFEAWITEDPAREAEVQRLRDLWEASAKVTDQTDTEAALAQVKERLSVRPPLTVHRSRLVAQGPLAASAPYAWRVAAAIALLVGGGAVWLAIRSRVPSSDQRAPMWTYATARAQRAALTLPDSSKVTLNTETRLEIPTSFGRRTRDVYLDGEAYFEVAHDHKRPFRVHAGNAVTEVLGTKFGVRAREGENTVQVAVAEGRVALSSPPGPLSTTSSSPPGPLSANVERGNEGERTVLERGDLGRLGSDGQMTVARGIDVGRILGWTEGRLAFDRAPLPQVLAELDRWFDRDFVLGDSSLASLRLTTALRGESLGEAIAVLEAALAVKARVVGRTVILKR
jgi:transmembrane sensor